MFKPLQQSAGEILNVIDAVDEAPVSAFDNRGGIGLGKAKDEDWIMKSALEVHGSLVHAEHYVTSLPLGLV